MCGREFTAGADGQQFIGSQTAICCYRILYHKVSFCNRSCFIHNYCFDIFQRFNGHTALKQNIFLGCSTDTGKECQRYGKYQSAGTADNQEGQGRQH